MTYRESIELAIAGEVNASFASSVRVSAVTLGATKAFAQFTTNDKASTPQVAVVDLPSTLDDVTRAQFVSRTADKLFARIAVKAYSY